MVRYNENISFPVGTTLAAKKYSEKIQFENILPNLKHNRYSSKKTNLGFTP